MRNVIAQRAGAVLDRCYFGPHRDKRIARDFGLSVRMVQHLRAGEHWTLDRLSQASALLGTAFDAALYQPASDERRNSDLYDIAERLARLEARIGQMDIGTAEGLAPEPGGEALGEGGAGVPAVGLGTGGRAPDRDG